MVQRGEIAFSLFSRYEPTKEYHRTNSNQPDANLKHADRLLVALTFAVCHHVELPTSRINGQSRIVSTGGRVRNCRRRAVNRLHRQFMLNGGRLGWFSSRVIPHRFDFFCLHSITNQVEHVTVDERVKTEVSVVYVNE